MSRLLLTVLIVILICKTMIFLDRAFSDLPTERYMPDKPSIKEGVYRGTGQGFVGDIKVDVIFKEESGEIIISDIKIIESEEVKKVWESVVHAIINKVIKNQDTAGIDEVTGATKSSKGLLEAIDEARKKAYIRH